MVRWAAPGAPLAGRVDRAGDAATPALVPSVVPFVRSTALRDAALDPVAGGTGTMVRGAPDWLELPPAGGSSGMVTLPAVPSRNWMVDTSDRYGTTPGGLPSALGVVAEMRRRALPAGVAPSPPAATASSDGRRRPLDGVTWRTAGDGVVTGVDGVCASGTRRVALGGRDPPADHGGVPTRPSSPHDADGGRPPPPPLLPLPPLVGRCTVATPPPGPPPPPPPKLELLRGTGATKAGSNPTSPSSSSSSSPPPPLCAVPPVGRRVTPVAAAAAASARAALVMAAGPVADTGEVNGLAPPPGGSRVRPVAGAALVAGPLAAGGVPPPPAVNGTAGGGM